MPTVFVVASLYRDTFIDEYRGVNSRRVSGLLLRAFESTGAFHCLSGSQEGRPPWEQLQVFTSNQFGQIRAIENDDQSWFVAAESLLRGWLTTAITGHNTQALNTVNAWQQQVSNHQPELLVIPTITP